MRLPSNEFQNLRSIHSSSIYVLKGVIMDGILYNYYASLLKHVFRLKPSLLFV